jgi:hypothetical protein
MTRHKNLLHNNNTSTEGKPQFWPPHVVDFDCAEPSKCGANLLKRIRNMTVRISNAAWTEIKRLYIAGHAAPQLSRQFGISTHAIYKRSTKERWRDDRLAEAIEPAQDNLAELTAAIRQLTTIMAAKTRVESI